MSTATTRSAKTSKKAVIPPPGRKLSQREAIEQVNKQYAKALAKLAK
jgi:hypothetical protein